MMLEIFVSCQTETISPSSNYSVYIFWSAGSHNPRSLRTTQNSWLYVWVVAIGPLWFYLVSRLPPSVDHCPKHFFLCASDLAAAAAAPASSGNVCGPRRLRHHYSTGRVRSMVAQHWGVGRCSTGVLAGAALWCWQVQHCGVGRCSTVVAAVVLLQIHGVPSREQYGYFSLKLFSYVQFQ